MFDLLWTLPALPLASFLLLALTGGRSYAGCPDAARLRRRSIAVLGVGSVGLSALMAIAIGVRFLTSPPPGDAVTQVLWTWISLGGFRSQIAFYLDPLSLVMILVITVVGFLIHLYAAEFMADDDGYARFFAYMNLFVAAMLILVLADNLLLLYLGWEGVGLCSYLLIGFWYRDPANGRAARKAFITTRIGDVAMAIGLFLLFHHLGTLNLQELFERATNEWQVGAGVAVAAAALLLGGALGKSAQLPLQTWLPDAMAGPTPVSALIHAATMVTAGVYLIARTHTLFLLAPVVLEAVAILGAVTLLLAAFSALVQRDIKRVLAYSTISQIGYMFLALGVGAWSAAIFHLMTHAFFKALLFLGAGVVVTALHHEHDLFKMGGLYKHLPVPFFMFLAGGAALAGFPLVTAGFYSKDTLLWAAWASERGSFWLWAAGLLGAFLTSLYIFRLIFLVFFGEEKTPCSHMPGPRIKVALGILAVLSIVGGFIELPATLGDVPLLSRLLERALPAVEITHHSLASEAALQGVAAAASLGGILVAYLLFFRRRPQGPDALPGVDHGLQQLWLEGWRFDRLYDAVLVRPYRFLATLNKDDFFDRIYQLLAELTAYGHRSIRVTQNGRLRWYAAALALGAVVVVALVMLP
ncbi:MAG: NADH-quinone oxidoreductase subunit L [Thermoanaerobaculia bacterium]